MVLAAGVDSAPFLLLSAWPPGAAVLVSVPRARAAAGGSFPAVARCVRREPALRRLWHAGYPARCGRWRGIGGADGGRLDRPGIAGMGGQGLGHQDEAGQPE